MEQASAQMPAGPRKARHARKRAKITAIGAAVILLALVGLGFLAWHFVSFTVGYVKEYLGPTEDVSFFENYITPIVMQDPSPFADVKKLDPDFIVKTAIWAALTDDDNSNKFTYTGDNREILPKADVLRQIGKLFGADVKPAFRTFSDAATSTSYEYNARDGCFYIPEIAYSNYYTPEVRAVRRSGDTVRLTVDYISGYGWAEDSHGSVTPPPASKTMLYVLQGARGKYCIVSVAAAPSSSPAGASGSETASAASSGSSPAVSGAFSAPSGAVSSSAAGSSTSPSSAGSGK